MATQTLDKESLSNRSFILNKPLDVSYVEQPKPTIQDPHDVLVAVNYTGICGSDVHYYVHGAIGHYVVTQPMVLGHESSGTVVEVGPAVTTLAPGDRVALEPGHGCRRCAHCRAGKYNLCASMVFAATVVVMGAGPVGLLCAAVARAHGATTVVSVDIVQAKLDLAAAFCATHTYASRRVSAEENAAALKQVAGLGEEGADVVIDASGAEPSIQTSIHAVRAGGTYVQGGMGKADITFPIMAMCLKEVTVKGSFRYGPGDYELAVELVASGKVDVKKLVSEEVDFDQAEEAFKKVREGQVIKVLIGGPNQ
ncbi:xylitol dehydrogenase [Cordyceps fumosorosea ARSEF 2679]|uniref:L-arabinitol 4-dehydrogenase n=1 Tax=Cordyceps fumosorosea (strain ARSEF 2679) TaxID=1081104 RepID=A0A167WP32_CORFA|nr:xylitol dehydrogenase [Cordyceps fumosorosea ARSEF 2679]OAA64035.1 xylitol dehydrogenase [Cordyceps fumosorosea ARSEF 2679]